MGKDPKMLRDSDILDEKYKGANAAVAAAGEAYYAHYWMALVGLVGGMAGALLFHNNIGRQIKNLRDSSILWVQSDNMAVRVSGKMMHGIFGTGRGYLEDEYGAAKQLIKQIADSDLPRVDKKFKTDVVENQLKHIKTKERGFGYWLLDHTAYKIPGVKDKLSTVEGIDTAVAAGGLLGAFGFFVAPWFYAVKGVHNAFQGKDQFKRAQQEVQELREDLQFLENKNAELRAELRGREDIVLSKDAHPKVAERPSDPVPQDPHELDTQQARKDHHDSPVSITPPKIEPPEPAAPPVTNSSKEIAADLDDSDRHAQHKNHSDKHKAQAGKSHGATVRDSQAAAAEAAHSVA